MDSKSLRPPGSRFGDLRIRFRDHRLGESEDPASTFKARLRGAHEAVHLEDVLQVVQIFLDFRRSQRVHFVRDEEIGIGS